MAGKCTEVEGRIMSRSSTFTSGRIESLFTAAQAAGFAMVPSDEPPPPPARLLLTHQPQDLATLAWRSPRTGTLPHKRRAEPASTAWRDMFASFGWRAIA
jgi:hypothetical protein